MPGQRIMSLKIPSNSYWLKNADLVVVKGDPSVRIADIENVELVFRDGLGFDSAKLLDSVKGKFGLY